MSDRIGCARCRVQTFSAQAIIEAPLNRGEHVLSINPLQAQRAPVADVWTPNQLELLDALAGAYALVAHADGWVTPDERRRMLERMRGLPALAVFGVDDALEAFEALDDQFERNPVAARAAAHAAIRRVRGRHDAACILVAAACAVAAADGGFDAEERDVLLKICSLLALEPAQFGLVVEGGVS